MTATLSPPSRGTDALERPFDLHGWLAPHRPPPRAAVRRPRLVAALGPADGPRLAVLVAPAGYGKTTLLREWCAHDTRPFAWVTLDSRHDDPRMLLRSITGAADAAFAEATDGRIVLVLDDLHAVRSAAAHEILAAIAVQPPEGMSVAFAARSEPPLPVARLRAEGVVTELRTADLRMTRAEAGAALRAAGLTLEREGVELLRRRTEGWAAGLSLAALSLAGETVPAAALRRFGGDDRLVADYLREEVLAGLSEDDLDFVRQTSILGVLSGPLCDVVLERSGSAGTLAKLLGSGFPLVALDRTGERYRHHRLLGDLLRTELHRTDTRVVAALHLRASGWHAQSGDRDRALQHALAADAVERAGDFVWAALPGALELGTSTAIEHWLSRFADAQVAADPHLALVAAGTQVAHGQGHRAEHWLRAASAATPGPDDVDEVRGGVCALRAALGRDGLDRMRADAADGSRLLMPGSPCQALCDLVAGIADHLQGDTERARERLEDGARRAAVPAPQIQALCLAQLALAALDEHDSEGAARLALRARSQVARYRLGRYPTSALVLAVSALVRAQRGRVEEASRDAREAGALVERLVDLAAWYEIEVEIVLARAALRLSEVREARARLCKAGRLAARLPDAVVLHGWVQSAEADLADYTRAVAGLPWALTTAEMRILQFLPTHLSFREIGERAFVSPNTVKTQANAVYRKLHVRSRSDAVACAQSLGLIDG